MTEALQTYIKIQLITSILLIIPYIIYQIWSFTIPCIEKYKRNFLNKYLFFSFFIFILSSTFSYIFLLPAICSFLLSFEINSEIIFLELQARIKTYTEFTFTLYLFIIFILQIPIILQIILQQYDINLSFFLKYRKYFLLLCLIISSFLSPPEIWSQLSLTLFLFFWFEFIIFFNLLEKINTGRTKKSTQ